MYYFFLTTVMKFSSMEKTNLMRLMLQVRLFRDFLERADLMFKMRLKFEKLNQTS